MKIRTFGFGALGLAAGLGLGLGLARTMPTPAAPTEEDRTVIVTFGNEGGLCPDGPCSSETSLYADGTLSSGSNLSIEEAASVEASVRLLEEEVEANLDGFSKDCGQSASDGSDFFIGLPDSGARVEACHPFSPEGLDTFEALESKLVPLHS